MLTTNEATYGGVEFAPELFQDMLKHARPQMSANLTFTSQWGDDVKKNNATWKKQLKTTKQLTDESVYKNFRNLSYEEERRAAKEKFFQYVRRQRHYYGELLDDQCNEQIDLWLRAASPEEKSEFLSAFRDMYASANPNLNKSEYQVKFKGFRPGSAWGERSREREENKQRVRGFVATAEDKIAGAGSRRTSAAGGDGQHRIQTKAAKEREARRSFSSQAGSDMGEYDGAIFNDDKNDVPLGSGGGAPMPVETFKSQVPLSWVTASDEVVQSTYQDAHCGNFPVMVAQLRHSAMEKAKMRGSSARIGFEATAPYGKVNPVMDTTNIKKMPVPQYLLHPRGLPTGPGKWRYVTTNRITYMERSREALEYQAQKAREAVEASMAERHRSSIPLGKQGIMQEGARTSTYTEQFSNMRVF
mmetsp:Transcript_1287/g.5229  ORF Transcript_1287/g.5229 Transcript_1287/m.5229 type:complete len:416 (+) Transcript_1287:841-2088(+)